MKSVIFVVLGIILLWAAFGSPAGFYRVRRLSLRGAARLAARVVYALAGGALIVLTVLGII